MRQHHTPYHALPIFVLIFIIAFFFRIAHTTEVGVWADELAIADDVARDIVATLDVVAYKGDHVPLYHILYHIVPFAPYDNVINLRMVTILSSLLALAVFVRLLKDHQLPPLYIIAGAFLLATHPTFITFSREARAYPFVIFLLLLMTVFFFAMLRGRRTTFMWLAFTFTSMLAYFTHFTALMIMGAQTLAILWHWRMTKRINLIFISRWLLACGIACAPMVVWSIFIARNNPHVGNWIPPITLESVAETLTELWVGGELPWLSLLSQGLILLGCLLSVMIVWHHRHDWRGTQALYWLTLAITPILFVMLVSIFLRSMWVTRYMVMTIPAWVILFVWGMSRLPHRSSVLSLIIVAFTTTALSYHILTTSAFERPESYFETPLFAIDEQFQPGDALYMHAWGNYLAIYGRHLQNITPDNYLLRWQWQADIERGLHNLDALGFDRIWMAFIPEVMDFMNTDHPHLHYVDVYRDIQIWRYDVPR